MDGCVGIACPPDEKTVRRSVAHAQENGLIGAVGVANNVGRVVIEMKNLMCVHNHHLGFVTESTNLAKQR